MSKEKDAEILAQNWMQYAIDLKTINSENLRSKIINPLNSLLCDAQLKVAEENLAKNYNYSFEKLDQILEVDAIFALKTLKIISTIVEYDYSIFPKIEILVEYARVLKT